MCPTRGTQREARGPRDAILGENNAIKTTIKKDK